jgi:ribosomal protein S18 acetylase RimI-like enzyme
MSPTIRPFRTDEADALRDIRFEALADLPMAFGEHLDQARAMGGEDFSEALARSDIWGAFDDDGPIAMSGLRRSRGANLAHRATIVAVYVRPAARGTGAGRAMLRGLIDYGVSRGVEIFELSVGDFNTSARKLYESLGFVEIGFLKNATKIGPDYTHEVQMALHVDALTKP